MRQPTILIPFFLAFQIHVKIVKAYLQKKGTTTMKCASSAETDMFVQAVALCIAVTSPTVRRCDLPGYFFGQQQSLSQQIQSATQATSYQCASPSQQQAIVFFQVNLRKVHLFGWRLGTCLLAFCKHRPNPRLRQCLQEDGRLIPSIYDSRM